MKQLFQNLKTKLKPILNRENLITFYYNHKNFVLICFSLLVLLVFILLIFSLSNKDDKTIETPEKKIELTQPMLIPSEPTLSEDFYLSREPDEKLSSEDVERWFVDPNKELIEQLRKENSKKSEEILKAVP